MPSISELTKFAYIWLCAKLNLNDTQSCINRFLENAEFCYILHSNFIHVHAHIFHVSQLIAAHNIVYTFIIYIATSKTMSAVSMACDSETVHDFRGMFSDRSIAILSTQSPAITSVLLAWRQYCNLKLAGELKIRSSVRINILKLYLENNNHQYYLIFVYKCSSFDLLQLWHLWRWHRMVAAAS